jgi:DDB1- and CUL4-associated factor 7
MSTFHMDGSEIQILDMRSPGQPVLELKGHRAQINGLGWGSAENPLLATAGNVYSGPLIIGFNIILNLSR